MKNKYKRTRTSVSLINYHVVFCPRYRRKIFLLPDIEERFKELVYAECRKQNVEILAMECHRDHVHMFISVNPQAGITDVVKQIKGVTSRRLRQEFSVLKQMPSLWTRSYYVGTAGDVSSETIRRYVESQKTRT